MAPRRVRSWSNAQPVAQPATGRKSASNNDAQHLLDRLAIQDLMATYYRSLDQRDWDTLQTIYTADAQFRSPPGIKHEGREAIVSSASRIELYKRTMHFMGNHIATISGDKAEAETYAIAHHYYDEDGEEQEYVIGIRYNDVLRKQEGRWKIIQRHMSYAFLRGRSLLFPDMKSSPG